MQAEADARERHWQSQVSGLQSKVEKLESLLQREMGHHQIASPTPRPVYDISPVGPGGWLCTLHCSVALCMNQIASPPTPRPLYYISPVGPGGWLCTFHLCSFRVWTHVCLLGIQITIIITIMIIIISCVDPCMPARHTNYNNYNNNDNNKYLDTSLEHASAVSITLTLA